VSVAIARREAMTRAGISPSPEWSRQCLRGLTTFDYARRPLRSRRIHMGLPAAARRRGRDQICAAGKFVDVLPLVLKDAPPLPGEGRAMRS